MGLSTDVIEGIKSIKYLSWEETFSEKILKLRKVEFKMLSNLKIINGFLNVFYNSLGKIFLLLTLIIYIDRGHTL